jgi:hypothetical protein
MDHAAGGSCLIGLDCLSFRTPHGQRGTPEIQEDATLEEMMGLSRPEKNN